MKYTKIKSIKPAPADDIYHLSVKKNQNFFANKICVHNCYRGNLAVKLYNFGEVPLTIAKGDRIAQIVIHKLNQVEFQFVDQISETERGNKGLGSSGN